jgi:hypothetical protein
MDLDEQGPQVADTLLKPRRRLAEGLCLGFVTPPLRVLGERRKPERNAGQVLYDTVMQVGRDPSPLQ